MKVNLKAAYQVLTKYETYLSNIKWHIEKNSPSTTELNQLNQRISDLEEFIKDLKSILPHAVNKG